MAPGLVVNDGNVVYETAKQTNNHASINADTSVLHRSLHSPVAKVVKSQGLYVYLESGQKILDSTGGAAVASLGHGNKLVKDAIIAQMDKFSYSHTLLFTSQVGEDLAKLLCESTNGHMTKALFLSSGSEAMEAAMKLARQYFLELPKPEDQRTKFIARKQSYHGVTLGALSMSGHVARRKLYEPVLGQNVSRVSACNAYRDLGEGETVEAYIQRLVEELDAEFQRLGPDTVCAFVAEPVVGAALGCVPAVEGYFTAMEKICRKYGALMILDEVMCGMGRGGTLHSWQQEGIVPDVQTIGKSLGGGYAPIAGLLINKRVVDVLDKGTGAFSHGQTYQGHPIACAAALEVQRVIREEKLLQNVRLAGEVIMYYLHDKLDDHPNVGNIRGKGLFIGIEFVKDKRTKEPFEPTDGVANGLNQLGLHPKYSLSLYPGNGSCDGVKGDHIMLAPPYTINEVEARLIVDLTAAVIEEYFSSR